MAKSANRKNEKGKPSFHAVAPDLFNDQEKVKVFLVGCGGSGSHILTRLALLNYALVKMEYLGLDVTVFDDDIVEENNVGRQMFTRRNVGENKAMCAVGKINMAYGYDWKAEPMRYMAKYSGYNIIITAVDNIETRKQVQETFYYGDKKFLLSQHINNRPMYWIDCGNGKDFGQVLVTDQQHTMPSIFDMVDNLEEQDKDVSIQGEGCSYADKLDEQCLFINTDIAQIVGSMLEHMFIDRYLTFNIVYSNLRTMTRVSVLKFVK